MSITRGPEVSSGNRRFVVHYFTGIVMQNDSHVESTTTGGGTVHEHSRINVSTIHTHKQTLFLKSEGGTEKSFDLVNFKLNVREGQKLTLIWLIKKGKERGFYTHAYNHNTDETFLDTEAVVDTVGKPKLYGWLAALLFCLLSAFLLLPAQHWFPYLFTYLFAPLIGGVSIYGWLLVRRVNTLKRDKDLTSFLELLADE